MTSNSVGRRIICVLGMHRSGTSLLARVLNLLGVDLGVPEAMRPADRFNPTGYWEHQAFIAINDELLKRHGGSWREPPYFEPGWEKAPELAELGDQGRAAVPHGDRAPRPWAWKDPRTCVTLPFWRRALGEFDCLLCLRNPVDVAHSLSHTMPFEFACQLWHRYVGASLQHTAGKPRQFLFYEDLVDSTDGEIRRLAGWLGLAGPEVERAIPAVAEFLDRRREHHRTSSVGVLHEERVTFPTKALYVALRQHVDAHRLGREPSPHDDELLDTMATASLQAIHAAGEHYAELCACRRELRDLRAANSQAEARRSQIENTLAAETAKQALERAAQAAAAAEHGQTVERLRRRIDRIKRRLHYAERRLQSQDLLAKALFELSGGRDRKARSAPRSTVSPPRTYDELISCVREIVEDKVPDGASVLVVGKGDDRLVQLRGCSAAHFPQDASGAYAGHHPADSAAAIEHLESLRDAGAEYLLFPRTSLWWLEHYREFKSHLDTRYTAIVRDETVAVLYALTAVGKPRRDVISPTQYRSTSVYEQIAELTAALLPVDATTLVITGGDKQLLAALGANAREFRSTGSEESLIKELNRGPKRAARFLVIPQPSTPWVEGHPKLHRHIERHYRRVTHQHHVCAIYDLSKSRVAGASRIAGRDRNGHKPSRKRARPR